MKALQSVTRHQILAEINMIPFIDVALVLLIIFMVMTPFLVRSQIRVDLPKSKVADVASAQKQNVTVQVQKTGSIFVDGRPATADSLESMLRASLYGRKDRPVVIEADRDAPFHYVVQVMSTVKKIGVSNLGVAVIEDRAGRSKAGQK